MDAVTPEEAETGRIAEALAGQIIGPDRIEFAGAGHPVASVIVPVYGKWQVTENCLRSLAGLGSAIAFEVIVVDDCSPDETAERVAEIPGVRYVRTEVNSGFVTACNLGAEVSRGSVLVFLNNDTLVHERWLDVLIETMNGDPSVGLVGSLLMYPDGYVQESGGIIFQDAAGHNFGRRWLRDSAAIRGTRDVDYCSGASMAVRRELFEQLGGFDLRFAPAYYEDTDLCFGIRSLGYRVVVQPESVVTHLEGVSNGRDETGGLKRFQNVNRIAFLTKWRRELERHGPNLGPQSVWKGRHRRPRGMILIYESDVPTPDRDSGSRRLKAMIDEIRDMGFAVYIAPAEFRTIQPYAADLEREGVTVLVSKREQLGFLAEAGPELGAVMMCRPQVARNAMEDVIRFAPQALTIYDSVDLHGLRLQAQAEVEGNPALRRVAEYIWALEKMAMELTDVTLVVSPSELSYLSRVLPDAKVDLVSNIHAAVVTDPKPDGRADVLMVGNYHHAPNVDSAFWLVREIMPVVWRTLPDVRLKLVGANVSPEVMALAGDRVDVLGWVPDLEPVYASARVVAAALRYGAGVKGKVAEAIEHGLPVVGTTVAFEGMPMVGGQDVAVADTAEEFAAELLRALVDDEVWTRHAGSGQARILDSFSSKQARTALERVLADVPGWVRPTPADQGVRAGVRSART